MKMIYCFSKKKRFILAFLFFFFFFTIAHVSFCMCVNTTTNSQVNNEFTVDISYIQVIKFIILKTFTHQSTFFLNKKKLIKEKNKKGKRKKIFTTK